MKCTLAAIILLVAATGCYYAGIPELLKPYDLQTDPDGDGSFETARPVPWVGNRARVAGGISADPANVAALQTFLGGSVVGNNYPPPSENDIFALGRLQAGDQLEIAVVSLVEQIVQATPFSAAEMVQQSTGQSVMLVDAGHEILGYPAAAPVVVDREDDYYLVIQSFVPGDYALNIIRTPGQSASPRRGVVLVQFGGNSNLDAVFMDKHGVMIQMNELPPFDLEQTRPDFAGQTARFKEQIRQFIEYIFADYDVRVTLDADEAEALGPHDLLVFTAPSATDLGFENGDMTTLGIEPTIDVENSGGQVGIIFVNSFEKSRYLDFNSYAALWATVAAHEYGHSVGLWHVSQESDSLMTPAVNGIDEARTLKKLLPAPRQEANSLSSLEIIQNPDRYLSRVLGRRPPAETDAVMARTSQLLGIAHAP